MECITLGVVPSSRRRKAPSKHAEQAPEFRSNSCIRVPHFRQGKKQTSVKTTTSTMTPTEERRALLDFSSITSRQSSDDGDYDDNDNIPKFVSPSAQTTITESSSSPESLLTMPMPEDRSHKRRLELERSGKRQSNTYHGEIEPAGYRGQEAAPNFLQLDVSNGEIQGAPALRSDFGKRAISDPIRVVVEETAISPITKDRNSRHRNDLVPNARRSRYEGEMAPPLDYDPRQSRPPVRQQFKQRTNFEGEMAPPSPADYNPPSPDGQPPSLRPRRDNNEGEMTILLANSDPPSPDSQPPSLRQKESRKTYEINMAPRQLNEPIRQPDPIETQAQTRRSPSMVDPLSRSPSSMRLREQPTRIDEIGAHLKQVERNVSRRNVFETKDPRKLRIRQSKSPIRDVKVQQLQHSYMDGESSSTHSDDVLQAIDLVKDIHRGGDATSVNTTPSISTVNLDAWSIAAKQHVETGEFELALALFNQLLSLYTKKYGLIHPLVASVYHNLGMVHSHLAAQQHGHEQRQERQASLECFQAAARTARDSLGKDHANVAVSLVRVGFLLLQGQQYKNALVTFTEALRIRLVHFGNKAHELVANLYNNLGICYLHLKQPSESQKYLDAALEMQRSLLKIQRTSCTRDELRIRLLEVADTLCNVGGLYLEKMSHDPTSPQHRNDAELAFTEALEIRSTVLGPTHLLVQQIHTLLNAVRAGPPTSNKQALPVTESPSSKSLRSNVRVPPSPESPRFDMISGAVLSPISNAPSTPPRPSGPRNEQRRPRALIQESSQISRNSSLYGQDISQTPESLISSLTASSTPRSVPLKGPESEFSPLTVPSPRDDLDAVHSPIKSRALVFSPLDPPSPRHPYRGHDEGALSAGKGKPTDAPEEERARYISGAISPPGIVLPDSWDSVEKNLTRRHIPNPSNGIPGTKSSNVHTPEKNDEILPIKEIVVDNPPIVMDEPRSSKRNWTTRIWVSPHYIPSRSPPRQPIQLDGTSLNGPPSVSKGSEYSRDGPHCNPEGLFSEESCLLSEIGVDSDQAIAHLINSSKDIGVDNPKIQLSNHEIIVVRPYGPNEAEKSPEETLEQSLPSIKNSRSHAIPRNTNSHLDFHFSSMRSDNLETGWAPDEENDHGIAPLFARRKPVTLDAKTTLTKPMLDEPEIHLFEIHAIAARYIKKNRLPEALHLFLLVLKVQRKLNGELHEDVGAALHNVGLAQLCMDRYELSRDSFARAVRIRKSALGRDHPDVALTLMKMGITLLLLHEFDQALLVFRDALSTRKRALGALHPSLARVYNNIGCVHVEFNELRDARQAFEAALDIQRNALCHEPTSGIITFGVAITLCNLGYIYRHRDMPEKAALVLQEALRLQEGVLGLYHPTVLSTIDSLAESFYTSSKCLEALRCFSEILNRWQKVDQKGGRNRGQAVVLYKMSKVYRKQNDIEAALKKLQSALMAVRAMQCDDSKAKEQKGQLERQIILDISKARDEMDQKRLEWI